MLRSGSFNQLLIFQAIVREGSIRGAARTLEMAAPSVSQALKQLELQLGLPLFLRTTRRIELTEAGQLLAERTGDVLRSLNYALESVHDLSEVPSGKLRLTLPRFVYQLLLRPIYAQFCRRYPQIQLEISVSDATVNLLRDGFDLGIRFGERVEEGMVARPLTPPMREALFASPDYLQRYGLPTTPQALQQHRLIQYRFLSANQLAPLILDECGQSLTVEMPTALIVNDTDAMLDAALAGLGIGRIVEPVVTGYLSQRALLPVLEPFWKPYSGLYVYFPQASQKARRVRVLIDFLSEQVPLQWHQLMAG